MLIQEFDLIYGIYCKFEFSKVFIKILETINNFQILFLLQQMNLLVI